MNTATPLGAWGRCGIAVAGTSRTDIKDESEWYQDVLTGAPTIPALGTACQAVSTNTTAAARGHGALASASTIGHIPGLPHLSSQSTQAPPAHVGLGLAGGHALAESTQTDSAHHNTFSRLPMQGQGQGQGQGHGKVHGQVQPRDSMSVRPLRTTFELRSGFLTT